VQLGLLAALVASMSLHGASFAVTLRSCAPRAEGAGVGAESAQAGVVSSDLDIDGLEPVSTASPAPEPPPPAPPPSPPPPKPAKPAARKTPTPSPPGPDGETPEEEAEAESAVPVPVPAAESGAGPNSLGAQRQRLGGGAECDDAVAGVWKSSIYDPLRGQWYAFTLTMRRDGEYLSGTIVSKFWTGPRHSARMPSSCAETSLFAQVSMPATGSVEGTRIRFGARSANVDRVFCGDHVQYTPDRFSGHVDPDAHELQSIVTDGLNLVDQPMLFRRVSCLP